MWKIRIPTDTLQDARQREVVFLSHCILNENTRYLGGSFCPGAMTGVVGKWMDKGAGIVQMPCPEQLVWGGVNKTWMWLAYASLGTVRQYLSTALLPIFLLYTRLRYKMIACDVCKQMKDYRKAGYKIVGVVGIDGSPTCGVRRCLSMEKSTEFFAKQT
jgi:predicted secreted protein